MLEETSLPHTQQSYFAHVTLLLNKSILRQNPNYIKRDHGS